MGWFTTAIRRSLWIVLITAAGGAAWSWRRDAADASTAAPAEWPPLATPNPPSAAGTSAPKPAQKAPTVKATKTTTSVADAASFVNALVDAPEARSTDGSSGGWAEPLADGSCPVGYPIKANDNSGIFHLPDGRFYGRTKPERCYSNAETAVADGYRQAKN
jgi:hypothetical protein